MPAASKRGGGNRIKNDGYDCDDGVVERAAMSTRDPSGEGVSDLVCYGEPTITNSANTPN